MKIEEKDIHNILYLYVVIMKSINANRVLETVLAEISIPELEVCICGK